jgi:hypothetical protein
MANRPTPSELAAWLKIPGDLDAAREAQLQMCIDAAIDYIEDRCELPNAWNQRIRLAVLMQAARWHKRKDSPEGVAGFGEMGAVRVMSLDPDIERILSRYLKFEIG